jgi:hypothetical protein
LREGSEIYQDENKGAKKIFHVGKLWLNKFKKEIRDKT